MHYLLFYELDHNYLLRCGEFRDAHLTLAWDAQARGELLLGGAMSDPVDGAVMIFRGNTPGIAERFALADPYVVNGLVTRWWVREWKTEVGDGAVAPARPHNWP